MAASQPEHEIVAAWLNRRCGLPGLADIFLAEGYDRLSSIAHTSWEDLRADCALKNGHRHVFTQAIAELKAAFDKDGDAAVNELCKQLEIIRGEEGKSPGAANTGAAADAQAAALDEARAALAAAEEAKAGLETQVGATKKKLEAVVGRFKALQEQNEALKDQAAGEGQAAQAREAAEATAQRLEEQLGRARAALDDAQAKHAAARKERIAAHEEEVAALRRKGGELFRRGQVLKKEADDAKVGEERAARRLEGVLEKQQELEQRVLQAEEAAKSAADQSFEATQGGEEKQREIAAITAELEQSKAWAQALQRDLEQEQANSNSNGGSGNGGGVADNNAWLVQVQAAVGSLRTQEAGLNDILGGFLGQGGSRTAAK